MNARRIEGTGVDPELSEGLAAQVADPLWLLARQWQVGEFRGEDAATPIIVEALIDTWPVTQYWTEPEGGGDRTTVDRTQHGVPLEALAERESTTEDGRLFASVEAGLALLRRLRAVGFDARSLDAVRAAYPLRRTENHELAARDPLGDARLRLLAAGSLDGEALLADLAASGTVADLDVVRAVGGADGARLPGELEAWSESQRALEVHLDEGESSAWHDRAQSYRFGATAATDAGPIELRASSYPGGRLDWYDFDLVSLPDRLPRGDRTRVRVLASPLRFAGQPAPRWWEMEEGDTWFGDLAGGPDDVARSVLASWAAVAGDDWFVIPARLPCGSLARVEALRVYDNFSSEPVVVRSTARLDMTGPAVDRPWRWFELSHPSEFAKGAAEFLFVPPTIDATEESEPLEVVEFRRDEMANLAWAVEHTVEGMAGRGVRIESAPAASPVATTDGVWRFQVGTAVPAHWFPLVPVRLVGDDPAVVLRRGVMARTNAAHAVPVGRVLTPERPFLLDEAELPSGGLRVVRRYEMTRSSDGGAHLWVGRRKRPASGPMSRTPLEFDTLEGWRPRRRGSP